MRASLPRAVAVVLLLLPASLSGAPPSAGAQTARQQEQLLESLRREVSDALLASGKISAVTRIEPLVLKATFLGGGDMQIGLANSIADLNARPKDRAEIVRRLVAAALATANVAERQPQQTRDQFIGSLRLLVRHVDYASPRTTAPTSNKPVVPPLSRPLAGDAHIVVAFDRSESLLMASPGSGTSHGITDDALFDLALAETQKFKDDVTRETYGPLRFLAAREGTFSPSLLLVAELMADIEKDLGPDFLVAIPDRTLLLAAPARSATELMRALQASAQQRKSIPHIPHLIQRKGSGFVRYAGR